MLILWHFPIKSLFRIHKNCHMLDNFPHDISVKKKYLYPGNIYALLLDYSLLFRYHELAVMNFVQMFKLFLKRLNYSLSSVTFVQHPLLHPLQHYSLYSRPFQYLHKASVRWCCDCVPGSQETLAGCEGGRLSEDGRGGGSWVVSQQVGAWGLQRRRRGTREQVCTHKLTSSRRHKELFIVTEGWSWAEFINRYSGQGWQAYEDILLYTRLPLLDSLVFVFDLVFCTNRFDFCRHIFSPTAYRNAVSYVFLCISFWLYLALYLLTDYFLECKICSKRKYPLRESKKSCSVCFYKMECRCIMESSGLFWYEMLEWNGFCEV